MISTDNNNTFLGKYGSLLLTANRRNLLYTGLIFFSHFAYVSVFLKF